jgi:hypothetical protein
VATSASPAPSPTVRKAVEFYTIELSHLADGDISVFMTATSVDEAEPQLLNQEIVSERVASLDDALALIKTGVERSLGL